MGAPRVQGRHKHRQIPAIRGQVPANESLEFR